MAEIFNFSTIEEKTSSRSLSYKNFLKRRNDQKVDIVRHIFEKIAKKVKIEVTGPKKGELWRYLTFQQLKKKQVLEV